MDKVLPILIYGGTTEGRMLAEELCGAGFSCVVCVATEYGEWVLQKRPGLEILSGRLDQAEMKKLTASRTFLAVVDATHPYATVVSEQIKKSLPEGELPYLRLKRDTGAALFTEGICRFGDEAACVEELKQTTGNILLTTGSKNLNCFAIDQLKERLFVRVLPCRESLAICEEQGIYGRQLIAMQGPFCTEMNEAVIRQYEIKILVTKESGAAGGLQPKLEAASSTGTAVYLIGSPECQETGYTYEETRKKLYELAGLSLPDTKFELSLIGMGMGSDKLLTLEAKEQLSQAEVVFGAKRLLEQLPAEKERYPYYQAKEILPILEKKAAAGRALMRIAVLFSGDTGFFSGAEGLSRELTQQHKITCQVRWYPGISSMSYLAARGGVSLNDAAVTSIHGRNADVIKTVSEHKKTFLLVSGVEDMQKLGSLFLENGLSHITVLMGYQLSYPEEEIRRLTPEECCSLTKEGLYCCFIEQEETSGKTLTHGLQDGCFIRTPSSVPMTKEEVREVSICKLQLTNKSVLYDIGSGTGSVAVECAGLSDKLTVYAVEQKEEAVTLIRQNCDKFGVKGVNIIHGKAPDALRKLPTPTHAFIGGSGGQLPEILQLLYEKNPRIRVVINGVTLETIGNMAALLNAFPVEQEEIVQVQVSRSKQAGRYHLMQAENAVYILSFTCREQKEEGNPCKSTE